MRSLGNVEEKQCSSGKRRRKTVFSAGSLGKGEGKSVRAGKEGGNRVRTEKKEEEKQDLTQTVV